MKKVIFKFAIPEGRPVQMPIDAKILSVQKQRDQTVLWALCDPTSEIEENRYFAEVATGQWDDFTNMKYISTLQHESGLVWHYFEYFI